jgi:hypothetical protein
MATSYESSLSGKAQPELEVHMASNKIGAD